MQLLMYGCHKTLYLPSNFVNLSAFVASAGNQGKYKAIIYIFPASHLTVCDFNQNTAGLLAADLFPVDMYNISA